MLLSAENALPKVELVLESRTRVFYMENTSQFIVSDLEPKRAHVAPYADAPESTSKWKCCTLPISYPNSLLA